MAVVVVDRSGLIRHANASAQQLHAKLDAGFALHDSFATDDRHVLMHYLQSLHSLESNHHCRYMEGHLHAHEGNGRRVAITGRPLSTDSSDAVLSLVDITEQRAREEALEALAHTDPLTGLPNRLALLRMLRRSAKAEGGCTVAIADLDRFKQVNDRFGHAVGDKLLQTVASTWRALLPNEALLARMGGDEFCVVLPGPLVGASMDSLQRLRQADVSSALFNDGAGAVSVTIGVAHSSAGSVDEVLRQCDMALYAAKGRGRNQVAVYGPDAVSDVGQHAEQAEIIRRLNEQNAQLHRDARTDARTGLANARALAEIESVEIGASSDLAWQAVAVLFIDLDHFGAYNHHYGDSAGDEALRRVAAVLQSSARKSDRAFRKGGEEFVMVLPMADVGAARRVAENVATQLADLRIPHAGGPTGWLSALIVGTVSRPGETLRDSIARAGDAAMACKKNDIRATIIFTE
ncbi:MAG: diguanylate cyclase [Rubrivivax sp.]|nr:diguanylate cyclase [Rubrivivax sp.]